MRRSPSSASTSEPSSPAEVDELDGLLGDPRDQGTRRYRLPTGIAAAVLTSAIAVPVLLSGGDSGALEVEATASSTTTELVESTSTNPDQPDEAQTNELAVRNSAAAAQLAVRADDGADDAADPTASSAPPSTAAPATGSPDRSAPTTPDTSTTTAAPTTAAPTTAAPSTAAPTTAAPTTAAPTTPAPTAPEPVESLSPDANEATPGPGPEAPSTTPDEQAADGGEAPAPTTPTTAAPSTAPPTTEAPVPNEPTEAQWLVLRQCESGNDYTIASSNGLYFGAYQFDRSTWNATARSAGRTDLVDIQPNHAGPPDQDAMALQLWRQRGWSPWPTCGKKAAAA